MPQITMPQMMPPMAVILATSAAAVVAMAATPPKTILTVLIDDLGFNDLQTHNPLSPTPHIGSLARSGLELTQYHAYMYCSPTRRSILSGRFPVHLGTYQAPVCSNYLPLQMTLLPAKLALANFSGHMLGKGHLGYQTTDHLPANRGFDSHLGYLESAEHYYHGLQEGCDIPEYENLPTGKQHTAAEPGPRHGQWPPPGNGAPRAWQCHLDLWHNRTTAWPSVLAALQYDTNTYAQRAVDLITGTPASQRLFVHLMWHAVHSPYTPAPLWETIAPSDGAATFANYCPPVGVVQTPKQHERCNFGAILKVLDDGMANVTAALRASGRWQDTLMWVSSDNGGIGPGNNWPNRGQKATPWQGGTRVAAFLSGGWLPASLRGKSNPSLMHVVDVYPTLCALVGVDSTDTVYLPAHGPASAPRSIDGVNVLPLLLAGASVSPREFVPTTERSLIWQQQHQQQPTNPQRYPGDNGVPRLWKLITGAGRSGWYPAALGYNTSGKTDANSTEWPCVGVEKSVWFGGKCSVCSVAHPCLFDLSVDIGERTNLASQQPAIVVRPAYPCT
jgi:arylsulfatase A-like enzyme